MYASPVRVLLVEDNPGDARLILELLRMAGSLDFELSSVPRLDEAARVLAERGADLVLLDLHLPDSRGVETVTAMLGLAPETPVIVLTGLHDEAVAIQAVHAGAQDYLEKGQITGDLLVRAIRYALERAAREREAEREAEEIRQREALTSALAVALTAQQVASVVVRHALSMLGAHAGIIHLLDEGTGRFELLRAAGITADALAPWRVVEADAPNPLADAVRLGAPIGVRAGEWESRYPGLMPLGTAGGATAVVSLSAGPRILGAMAFELSGREMTEGDRDFLRSCAGKCALALERALLYEREQKAHAEAERAIRARDEILGVVAHDLRNPLGAISNYASLLEGLPTDEQRRRYLDGILGSTRRMDRLIQDLLDVTRLDAGHLRMETRPEPVRPLVREAVETVRAVAEEEGVDLRIEAADALPDVPLDRDRILQVLGNLLGNALRFTPPGGSITLSVQPLGREILFLLTDTGPGIPAEHLPHLFDRFWQARETRSVGAGLGLAIVKGIVEAHGGRVGVESRPGLGSTFFFALPAGSDEPTGPVPEPIAAVDEVGEPGPEEEPARPIRVLLADDHPAIRRGLAERLLREPGIEVVGEVASGEEAVEQTRIRGPDVVLMDVAMPGIGGLEATRRITARYPGVRVLAVTAEAEEDTLLSMLEAGASGFVRKTTVYEDLVPALHAVIRDEVYLYPSGNRLLLRDYMAAEDRGRELQRLSRHERDILALAAEGYSSEEIGRRLYLSPKTVDSYRSRAMRSLGLGHRTELVRFALRTGLLAARR